MKRLPRAIRRGRKFRARPGHHDGLSVIVAGGNRCFSFTPEAYAKHRIGKSVIVCRDGYRMSVIAGPGTRCSPTPPTVHQRLCVDDSADGAASASPDYHGPYHEVEVQLYGDPPSWWHALFPRAGTDPVGYVPVWLVRHLIGQHGGFARMEGGRGPRSQRTQLAAIADLYARSGIG